MNPKLQQSISKLLTRVNLTVGILVNFLPEVIRVNYEQRFGGKSSGGTSHHGAHSAAGECPVPHGASSASGARAAAEAGCPVTGHGASATAQAASAPAPKAESKKTQTAKAAPKAAAKSAAPKKTPAKKSVEKKGAPKASTAKKAAAPKAAASKSKAPAKLNLKPEALKDLKRAELYDIAQQLDIPGRKDKKKSELIAMIQKEIG